MRLALSRGACGARTAAVDTGLTVVLHTIAARGGGAAGGGAQAAAVDALLKTVLHTVAAPVRGALRGTRAAAVEPGFIAVLRTVSAPVCGADRAGPARESTRAPAVCCGLTAVLQTVEAIGGAGDKARAATVDTDLTAVLHTVVALRCWAGRRCAWATAVGTELGVRRRPQHTSGPVGHLLVSTDVRQRAGSAWATTVRSRLKAVLQTVRAAALLADGITLPSVRAHPACAMCGLAAAVDTVLTTVLHTVIALGTSADGGARPTAVFTCLTAVLLPVIAAGRAVTALTRQCNQLALGPHVAVNPILHPHSTNRGVLHTVIARRCGALLGAVAVPVKGQNAAVDAGLSAVHHTVAAQVRGADLGTRATAVDADLSAVHYTVVASRSRAGGGTRGTTVDAGLAAVLHTVAARGNASLAARAAAVDAGLTAVLLLVVAVGRAGCDTGAATVDALLGQTLDTIAASGGRASIFAPIGPDNTAVDAQLRTILHTVAARVSRHGAGVTRRAAAVNPSLLAVLHTVAARDNDYAGPAW